MSFLWARRGIAAESPGLAAAPLVAGAAIAPPLAVFAPLGIAPLLALLALLALIFDGRQALAAARPLAPLAALLALLSLWAAVTSLWSPIPGHSLFESARLLLLNAAGLVVLGSGRSLDAGQAHRLLKAALVGTLLAILLLQLELRAGAPLTHLVARLPPTETVPLARYDRGVTVLLLVSWSAGLGLAGRGQWPWLALGGVILALTLFAFSSHASMLALVVGAAVVPVARALPRPAAGVMAAGVLVLVVAGPLATPGAPAIAAFERSHPQFQLSAIHRLVIWRFVSDRIAERPVLGWGMDAARALPGGKTKASDYAPGVVLPDNAEALPLHPHDAALEWRVELGLPGALLCATIIALALWRLARDGSMPPWRRAIALGFAAAVLTIALLSFGAWQSWWLSSVWLAAAVMAGIRTAAAEPLRPSS